MSVTIVKHSWRICPKGMEEHNRRKNSFRPITDEEHAQGLENKQKVLKVLRDVFRGSGLSIILYGSQVYAPQVGQDFDLAALYPSRASLKAIEYFCKVDYTPDPVSRVLKAILGDEPSALLDFLELHYSSFRFKLLINGSPVQLNVFCQSTLERVANQGFPEDYRKIRILHPEGPLNLKRAVLFDGSQLWIPTRTNGIQLDGENYWLRGYWGWLYENGYRAVSGLAKTSVGYLVTSEIVLDENEVAARLIESAERTFVAALAAYSRERNVSVDPCDVFIRAKRFRPEFTEKLRRRIEAHRPSKTEIARFELPLSPQQPELVVDI